MSEAVYLLYLNLFINISKRVVEAYQTDDHEELERSIVALEDLASKIEAEND